MRILFCQTQFKMGGQQKVLLTVAKGLSKKHDITIYYENHSFFDLNDFNTIRPNKTTQTYNLIKVLINNFKKLNFNKKILADCWHLKNIESTLKSLEYDVVILLNPYILFVEEMKSIVHSKKIVCWTHNIFENYVESCFKYEKDQLFKSMSMADQVISLERYTASKWKYYNDNTVIIHNPLTIESKSKSTFDKRIICCTGRIQVDSKGLDLLCKVIKGLDNDIVVHYAGSGNAQEVKKFEKLIIQNGIEKKILLKGPLKSKELEDHYIGGSMFLMTSRYEGFPLVASEAMSFGLPFVGFNIPSLQEVTNDGQYGKLFEMDQIDEMSDYINMVINSNYLLRKQSDLSIERSNHFKLDNIIEDWNNKVLI